MGENMGGGDRKALRIAASLQKVIAPSLWTYAYPSLFLAKTLVL